MIKEQCFEPNATTINFICGPPAMNKNMIEHLTVLGHDQSRVFKF